MEALLIGSTAFLFGIWFFGYILGTGFSKTFEHTLTEPVKEPRPRSMRVSYPVRHEAAALQRV